MKHVFTITTLLLLATMMLTSCTSGISRGYISQKQYTPSYTSHDSGSSSTSCSTRNGRRTCSTYYHPGGTTYHDAQYAFYLTSCSSLQTDGQCQTGYADVDQSTYDHYHEGDYYTP